MRRAGEMHNAERPCNFTENHVAMDTKLTLNMRPDVIARAKEWAKREGKSLSAAVEEYLDKITRQAGQKTSLDIIRELGTQMKSEWPATDAEYEQKKRDYLTKKYGSH
jgi:hypothetical protein